VKTLGAAAVALGTPVVAQGPSPVRFGVDMFSLGAQNWTPFQQLDFAAKWNVKVVHFSEIRFLGNLEPDHLKKVRARAEELAIDLEIGMRSICPTSAMFDKAAGSAEEQLGRMLTYLQKCPGKAVSLEVIVSAQPRMFNYANPDAWALYRNQPAWEFARFLALAEEGKPTPEAPPDPSSTPAARNLANVESSIRWTQARV
jgi:hypothetical protein